MQAIGNGIIGDGIFACNIGTGGQISTSVSGPRYDIQLRASTFAHAIPGKWNIMAAVLNAGASLKWFARQVLDTGDYRALDREAEKIRPGCEGLLFLPYLTGERYLKDPGARGVFFGLTGRHNRFSMARAVMEGVVFALKDCLGIITDDIGIPCKKIIAAGGGAAGSLWPQIQADILGYPIVRSLASEQACLGAAITAGIGTGVFPDAASAAASLVKYDDRVYEPREEFGRMYREQYAVFRDIYDRGKDIYPKIAVLNADSRG
jgi:xylulokinase